MPKRTTLPKPLRGIVPPMLTPLTDRDTLDVAGLGRLVEHILAGRPAGLFILGTSGEGPSLGYRLRQELIGRVAELVAGRVPLLVGITDTSFADSVGLAEYAADEGAAAERRPLQPVVMCRYVFIVGQGPTQQRTPFRISHTKPVRSRSLPGLIGDSKESEVPSAVRISPC